MKADDDASFEDDCDSPQIGELDVQESVKLTMNAAGAESMGTGTEQGQDTREVLPDAPTYKAASDDDAAAHSGIANTHPSDYEQPADSGVQAEVSSPPVLEPLGEDGPVSSLPHPSVGGKLTRCSRNTNGHDVMDPLGELGEDCGMPEPIIPCETPGNSTKCPPQLVLEPPRLPVSEAMPPIPAPPYDAEVSVSVEFIDYGIASRTTVRLSSSVQETVVSAGAEFGVDSWHVQLVRNAGADITLSRQIHQLEDRTTLVVYLMCAPRRFHSSLIVRLQACEDVGVLDLQARVEVPETDDVYVADVKSNFNVKDVLSKVSVPAAATSKVTYNGVRVHLNSSLDQIHFANRSALVVYLNGAALPMPKTPSSPGGANATAVNVKSKTATGESGNSSVVSKSDAGKPLPKPVQIPNTATTDSQFPRATMTKPAVVTVHVEGHPEWDFKVLVRPADTGTVVLDALAQRLGKSEAYFNVFFFNSKIDIQTPMAVLGLVDGDIVACQML
jgi:hypothetical protein